MDNRRLLEILGRIPLFKDLTEEEKMSVLQMRKVYEVFRSGDVIVNEGEQDPHFYILLTGKASVVHKQQIIATVLPPEFIGEVGFMCGEPRIATVVAEENVMVMKVDKINFQQLPMRVREAIKDKIIAGLTDRLKDANSSLADLKKDTLFGSRLNTTFTDIELI